MAEINSQTYQPVDSDWAPFLRHGEAREPSTLHSLGVRSLAKCHKLSKRLVRCFAVSQKALQPKPNHQGVPRFGRTSPRFSRTSAWAWLSEMVLKRLVGSSHRRIHSVVP